MRGFGTLQDMDALMKYTESIQEQELIEIKNTPEQEAKLENVTIPIVESENWKDLVKKDGTKLKAIVESGDVASEIEVYKDVGKTEDYTVIIGTSVYEMNDEPTSPNGVNLYAGELEELPGAREGQKMDLNALPPKVQMAIKQRAAAVVESGDVVKNKPEEGAAGNAEEEDKDKKPLMGDVGLGVGSIGLGTSKKAGSTKLGTKGSCSVGKELRKKGLAENFAKDVVDKGPQDEAINRTRASQTVGKAKEMFDEMYGSAFGKQREFVLDTTLYGTKLSKEPIRKVPKGW